MAKTNKQSTNTQVGTQTGFSDDERLAMQVRAKELRMSKKDGESALIAKIEEMDDSDKQMAKKLHELIKNIAPSLVPKTWYGMPAYANAEGKVVCFFQAAGKFKARYATLGFSDVAHLDDGNMWPTSFALTTLTSDEEKTITTLLKKAVK